MCESKFSSSVVPTSKEETGKSKERRGRGGESKLPYNMTDVLCTPLGNSKLDVLNAKNN